jgi:hypothetical protein
METLLANVLYAVHIFALLETTSQALLIFPLTHEYCDKHEQAAIPNSVSQREPYQAFGTPEFKPAFCDNKESTEQHYCSNCTAGDGNLLGFRKIGVAVATRLPHTPGS